MKKKLAIVLSLVVAGTTCFSNVSTIYAQENVAMGRSLPDGAIGTGHVSAGVTSLRIRREPVTGVDNVIVAVDGGFAFDIYDKVYSSGMYWFSIGFNYGGAYTRGYVSCDYSEQDSYSNPEYTEDIDFEEYLNDQRFPESYKEDLRDLHAKYPKWIFVADYVDKDWNTVVNNEDVDGRSLIYTSAISSWKSVEYGRYDTSDKTWTDYDSGWVQASRELLEYSLDPRNFLNEKNIFMFESLEYNGSLHNEAGVNSIISGTFMQNSSHDLTYDGVSYTYPSAIMKAGQFSGVSPYHLASRIIQEQGVNGTSGSISGTVSGYEGYYNYFNQGAYKTDVSPVVQGLRYASSSDSSNLRPWNSRMLSLMGGSLFIGKSYINRGQNTIYYQKYDVVTSSPYWHQYMTNVLAARSESIIASRAYSESVKNNTGLIFTIPVYYNMPQEPCPLPNGDGNPDNYLGLLEVHGHEITPSFDKYTNEYNVVVENNVTQAYVDPYRTNNDAVAVGEGMYELKVGDNRIDIVVTAQNGNKRTYTVWIYRKDGPLGNENIQTKPQYSMDTNFRVDDDNMWISGINDDFDVDDVLNQVSFSGSYYAKIKDSNDKIKDIGEISTGDRLVVYDEDDSEYLSYLLVIYGDVNGDGKIDMEDFISLRKYLMGKLDIKKEYLEAADINKDGEVNQKDCDYLKQYLLDRSYIQQ